MGSPYEGPCHGCVVAYAAGAPARGDTDCCEGKAECFLHFWCSLFEFCGLCSHVVSLRGAALSSAAVTMIAGIMTVSRQILSMAKFRMACRISGVSMRIGTPWLF